MLKSIKEIKNVKYTNSLPFKLNIFMFLFSILLIISIYGVFSYVNKQEIKKNSYGTTILSIKKINIQLEQKLSRMQVLAMSLANLAKSFDSNDKKNKELLKNLLNLKGYENFIAGGGIWPEPNALHKSRKRDSYFFGRNKNGGFDFFDDYNDPKGSGYHNEEWYVPVKYYKEGSVYWSKSYIDPFTSQPMVTVTAPIYKDNKFFGAATIDIMLNGLVDFLKNNTKELKGYGFILDRNGKFLAYPDEKTSKIDNEYISFKDITKKNIQYKPLDNAINETRKINLEEKYKKLSMKLEKESQNINKEESLLIAELIQDTQKSTKNTDKIKSVTIKDDPILKKESLALSIYQVDTHWNLVVVIPVDVILSQSHNIFRNLIVVIILLVIISAILAFYTLKKGVINPISLIISQLNSKKEEVIINLDRKDEFGLLAYWFNRKSTETMNMNNEIRSLMKTLDKNVITSETDNNGIITFVSEAFCKISGYSKEQLLGKKFEDIKDPQVDDKVFVDIWNKVKLNGIAKGEIKNLKKDGGFYWLNMMVTKKLDEDGSNSGYTAIMYDITDKKELDELTQTLEIRIQDRTAELAREKDNIEQILSNILLPVLITSKEKRTIIYANKYAQELYEVDEKNIINAKVDNIYFR
jgi:PAS domain S-box-containing protein